MPSHPCRPPGRETPRKRIETADLGNPATAEDRSTTYEMALEARDFQAFRSTNVHSLIEQAAVEMKKRGIVDEIGALRIVLARLVTEEDDLQNLAKQVTQVVRVALAAATTQRLIDGDPFDAIAAALEPILEEVEAARKTAIAERTFHDNLD